VRGTRREPIHGGSYAAIHGGIWSRTPTRTPPPIVGWWPRSKRRAARHFDAIAVAPSVLNRRKQRRSKRGHDRAQPRQSVATQVERTGAESVRQSKATLSPSSWADQRRADQSRADQSRADQSRANQSRANQSRADQSRADQSRADQEPEPRCRFSIAHQLTVKGWARVGWRDHMPPWMAAYELTWTYLQRVPTTHPCPPKPGRVQH